MGFLVWIGILLIILWLILWLGVHIAGAAIHIIVVVGIILIIWGLIKRGSSAAP